jgi:hypothetical protein
LGAASRSGPASEADALFQLPLPEFTAARNALAARLKKSGHGDEATRVKGLPKPSVSAWAVNQLYWRHRQAFDRLVEIGERFRKAQASQLAGKPADVRGTLDARRQALSELARLAADTLRSIDHSPTPDMMRRITTTLEAIATYGTIAEAPPAGRLVDDVEPPGFETLAALVPRIGESGRDENGPSRILPFRQERQERQTRRAAKRSADPEEDERVRAEQLKAGRAAAAAAVKEAERALGEARKTVERAEATLKKAVARNREADKEKAEAERRLEKATADASDARQQARSVAADAEQAAQAVEDAERTLEKTRKEREALSES